MAGWKKAAVVLAVLMVTSVGVRWWNSMEDLSFHWESPTQRVQPGESVSIQNPTDECEPCSPVWYRQARFGRWRQTHIGPDRAEVRWWDLSRPSHSRTIGCAVSGPSFELTVPADVEWSPVAACVDVCVEIEVELSG